MHPFILIPGRTSTQGTALNEGKYTQAYLEETGVLKMAPADMARIGIVDNDAVRMWNEFGEVTVPCQAAKGDELPPGILFISYGDKSSRLMGGETHGSGMPDSKCLDVWIEKA
jgi:formylmethanofuran dehydrogenase subunit D